MVRFDGVDQAIEDVWYGMGHAAPVGNHGHTEGIVEKAFRRQLHAFQEYLDGRSFLMPIEREDVDGGVVFVAADRFLSGLQIGRPQGLERSIGEDDPFARQVAKEGFRDIDAHLQEAGFGVMVGEFLMFMVIGIRNIGLANAAQRTVAVDLREYADFEPPVSWNSVRPGQVPHHGELASQRVAKAIKKRQQRMRSDQLLEAPDHGGEEEPGYAPMQPVGDAAVIAFAEFIAKIRVGDGITKAREIFPIVARDIAIVQRDDLALISGQYISKRGPTASSLAL